MNFVKVKKNIYDGFNKKLFPLAPIGCTSMSAHIANNKVFDRFHLKIYTSMQILQRLPITRGQVKAGNTYFPKWNPSNHTFFVSIKTNY